MFPQFFVIFFLVFVFRLGGAGRLSKELREVVATPRVKNFSVPISEHPFPFDFNGVKRDLGKTSDAYSIHYHRYMNGYPDI